jgi:hypothetical protein
VSILNSRNMPLSCENGIVEVKISQVEGAPFR